jgi:hypothetical protein
MIPFVFALSLSTLAEPPAEPSPAQSDAPPSQSNPPSEAQSDVKIDATQEAVSPPVDATPTPQGPAQGSTTSSDAAAPTQSPSAPSTASAPNPSDTEDAPLKFAPRSVPEERIEFAKKSEAPLKPEFGTPTKPEPIAYSDKKPRSHPSTNAIETSRSPFGKPLPPPEPQRFAFELKFGPYRPGIDKHYKGAGAGPYESIFGRTDSRGQSIGAPPLRVLAVLGFEWQFLHFGGPLALGTSLGFFKDSANSLLTKVPADPTANLRSNADKTTFSVVPITLSLGYRFEWAANRFHVPIVPYGKIGFLYGVWWSKDGMGNLSRTLSGEKARGGSPGWQADLGAMLRMTDFDRDGAKKLNNHSGINHINLFGEYRISETGQLGGKKKPNVGASMWMAGIVVEF